jgi:hypothetical protein
MARMIPMMAALAVLMAGAPALAHNHEKSETPAAAATEAHASHHANHHGAAPEGHMPPDFATLDANGDGQLEKTELPEGHRMAGEHFDMMDKDKDGKVSKAEFDAMHAGHEGHH